MEAETTIRTFQFTLQEDEYRNKGAYHRTWLPRLTALRYRFALRLLPPSLTGKRCLDFGGGDGFMATKLASRGGNVTVFDPVTEAVSLAKEQDARLSVVQGMTHLPFASESFTIATCLETLEHISDGEEQKALAELFRVLQKDGTLIISAPSTHLPVAEKHYRHYSPNDLTEKIQFAGFTVEEMVGITNVRTIWPHKGQIHRAIRAGLFLADAAMGSIGSKLGMFTCAPELGDSLVVLARK